MENLNQKYKQYINGNEPITREILRALIRNDLDVRGINTSEIKDMSWLFSDTDFNQDISEWNTSNVIDMGCMFYNAKSFDQSLNSFDTSKVNNMWSMFTGASRFNKSIASFDTSKVNNMRAMFYRAEAFNQSLNNFDTREVNNMSFMFWGANNLVADLSKWNVSKAKHYRNFTNNKNIILPQFKKVAQ